MSGLKEKYVLENEDLRIEVISETFAVNVLHKSTGQEWVMTDETFDEVVLEVDGEIRKETLAGCRNTRVQELGRALFCHFPDYRLQLLVAIDGDHLGLEFIPLEENDRFKIKGICYPRSFILGRGHDEYMVRNGQILRGDTDEDILQPADLYQFNNEKRARTISELFPAFDHNWWSNRRPSYGASLGSPLIMGWWGAKGKKGSMMAVLDEESRFESYTNYRHTRKDGTLYRHFWLPSMGKLSYPRRMTFHFLEGGYVEMARHFRPIAEARGHCVTLREKLERNPRLAKVIGGPVLHFPVFLKHDTRYFENTVMMSFQQAAELAEQFKQKTGFERAHVHCRGWQRWGHDIHYPEMMPPARQTGGAEGFRELARRVHSLGYAFGVGGDNYADLSVESPMYDESLRLIMANGKSRRKNTWASGLTEDFCSRMALPFVRKNFEIGAWGFHHCEGLLDLTDMDVYWIGNFFFGKECYDPRHPMTRNQCREYQKEIFQYVNDQGRLLFIEGTSDAVFRYFYTTRIPKCCPGNAPMVSLVYHDCITVNGGAGRSNVGILHENLNGAATHMLADEMHDAARVEEARINARLNAAVAYEAMVNHEFLSDDEMVQRAGYANGVAVTVDFGRDTYKIEGVEGIEEKERQACSS